MVDVVVLRPPEGVSSVSPPTTRSLCHPGLRPVDLYPWHQSLNKKIGITTEKILIIIFGFLYLKKNEESFGFCNWHPPPPIGGVFYLSATMNKALESILYIEIFVLVVKDLYIFSRLQLQLKKNYFFG